MINLATVQPHIATLKNMTEVNNHIGAWRHVASLLEDAPLVGSLDILSHLARPEGITKNLRPLQDLLYRALMDTARRQMTPDAFHAVRMSL